MCFVSVEGNQNKRWCVSTFSMSGGGTLLVLGPCGAVFVVSSGIRSDGPIPSGSGPTGPSRSTPRVRRPATCSRGRRRWQADSCGGGGAKGGEEGDFMGGSNNNGLRSGAGGKVGRGSGGPRDWGARSVREAGGEGRGPGRGIRRGRRGTRSAWLSTAAARWVQAPARGWANGHCPGDRGSASDGAGAWARVGTATRPSSSLAPRFDASAEDVVGL